MLTGPYIGLAVLPSTPHSIQYNQNPFPNINSGIQPRPGMISALLLAEADGNAPPVVGELSTQFGLGLQFHIV